MTRAPTVWAPRVREGAASVTQLDIYAQPGAERDEDADPWPTYPKIYRLSAAHEEARDLESAPAADADARLFAASTLHFSGDADGHVRALHLVEVDVERRRCPDPDGRSPPTWCCSPSASPGPTGRTV